MGLVRIAALAVLGCLLGAAVAAAFHFRTVLTVQHEQHGRTVTTMCLPARSGACAALLVPPAAHQVVQQIKSSTFESPRSLQRVHPGWSPTLPLYGAAGLAVGGLVGLARRQRAADR